MKDITYQLECARTVIRNLVGSHQATPEAATRYACRQLDLPSDVQASLTEYAEKLAHNN